MYPQLPQLEGKTNIPRVDTAPQGVETPNLTTTNRFMDSCRLMETARGENVPRDNVEVTPHTEMINSHPGITNSPYMYNSNNPGTKMDKPTVNTAPQGVETPPPFRTCTTPTTKGRKWTNPPSIPPRKGWKPHPRRLIYERQG